MTNKPFRYVGCPDFHDGYIRTLSLGNNEVHVTVQGDSGKHYSVSFVGVTEVELFSPQDMMLYALREADTKSESLFRFDFINWYVDEPDKEESKSYLRILAAGFTMSDSNLSPK